MELKPWHRHYDYNVPTTIRYPRLPIHELLGIPANAYPDKAALTFYGTEMTFWELRLQVLRFATALGNLGIQKGERVGIHLPNCPQYLIAYYAVLSLGAIVVNMNPLYTADELKLIAETTGYDDPDHLRHVPEQHPRPVQTGADPQSHRHQGDGLYQGSGGEHRRQPGTGKGMASFFGHDR